MKFTMLTAATLMVACANVRAQIPTTDLANVAQTTITAQESVAQTMKQVEEYKTQLEQYALQIKNATAPAAYVWDQAMRTMDQLRGALDTLAYYKRQLGSIDFYLRQFNDVNDYRASPCFGKEGCSKVDRERLQEKERFASEAQKRANEALIRSLDQQHAALSADARRLQQLQAGAQGAQGQMEAIGYANMLAGQQSNQLLQIRGLLVAQHTAAAAQMQAKTDREARESAAREQFRRGTFVASPPKQW